MATPRKPSDHFWELTPAPPFLRRCYGCLFVNGVNATIFIVGGDEVFFRFLFAVGRDGNGGFDPVVISRFAWCLVCCYSWAARFPEPFHQFLYSRLWLLIQSLHGCSSSCAELTQNVYRGLSRLALPIPVCNADDRAMCLSSVIYNVLGNGNFRFSKHPPRDAGGFEKGKVEWGCFQIMRLGF